MAKKIFLIAGEASGDVLGAKLMAALKAQSKEPLEFAGVGGPKMEAEGLDSLLPMEDLCVMGVWEVIWQLNRLMKIIKGLVQEIEEYDPDALVTIDLPDLNFQVASRLKKRGKTKAKLIHYVAPSVWAWRPKRADYISKFLDGLMCLLPFEPKYFLKIRADYVGHPVVDDAQQGSGARFRQARQIPSDVKTLGLFFGSRMSEIRAHKDILLRVARLLGEIYPNLQIIVPTVPDVEYEVLKTCNELELPTIITIKPDVKWDSFAACDAAVAVSGTVGLELAFAKVPHVIVYRTSSATWAIMKLLVKSQYAHLANILLNRQAIPEFLQGKADAVNIGKALLKLYKSEKARAAQAAATDEMRALLHSDDPRLPAVRAADFVLGMLDGSIKPGASEAQIAASKEKPKPKPKPEKKKPVPKNAEAKKTAAAKRDAADSSAAVDATAEAPQPKPFQEVFDLIDKVKALVAKKK